MRALRKAAQVMFSCGEKLDPARCRCRYNDNPADQTTYCGNCGRPNFWTAVVCSGCGKPL